MGEPLRYVGYETVRAGLLLACRRAGAAPVVRARFALGAPFAPAQPRRRSAGDTAPRLPTLPGLISLPRASIFETIGASGHPRHDGRYFATYAGPGFVHARRCVSDGDCRFGSFDAEGWAKACSNRYHQIMVRSRCDTRLAPGNVSCPFPVSLHASRRGMSRCTADERRVEPRFEATAHNGGRLDRRHQVSRVFWTRGYGVRARGQSCWTRR
jgi:hypothetical protein